MLHLIPLPICNVYLLKGDRPILIDTGRPSDLARIEAALKQHGVALSDLALLLHTHAHWDHCGSTKDLATKTKAPIAVHSADADQMRAGTNGVLTPTNLTAWLLQRILNGYYPAVAPTLLVEDEQDLSAYGVAAKVLHTPGHTAGSISVLTAARDAIVGDLVIGGWWGGKLFASRPGLHYFAEDLPQLYASVKKVLDHSPRLIYSGHGGPLEPAAVKRWLERRPRRKV